MKVNYHARNQAGPSGRAVNSSINRAPVRMVGEVQTVRNPPDNALVSSRTAGFSNPGGTWREVAVPASGATEHVRADNSVILHRGGRFYIQGCARQIEVHSLDDWATVLMSDVTGADGQCLPLRWHCGYWRIDDAAKDKVTTPPKWLEYGLIGNQPPESGELPPEIAHAALERFDFEPSLHGDFLKKWFIHDWFNPLPENQRVWPAWAIKYAKHDEVVSLYLVEKLLDSGAFPCEAAIQAYAREIEGLDKTDPRSALIHRITQGLNTPSVCKYFFSPRTLKTAKQLLVPEYFDELRLVDDYMGQFTLPKTADGDVLKIALLSDRLYGQRTPAWAGYYVNLACWKKYFLQVKSVRSAERQSLLTQVLADGCYGGDFAQAEAYLAKFAIADQEGVPKWELLEELVLDKLLDGGRWAARQSSEGPPLADINRS